MKALLIAYLIGWISQGLPAPVQEGDRGHRDSTKAILSLEQQLKQQAGEDKKYFSQENVAQEEAESKALAELEAAGAAQLEVEGPQDEDTLAALAALEGQPDFDQSGIPVEQAAPEYDDEYEHADDEGEASEQEVQEAQSPLEEELESDKKSPYNVYSVSEKRVSDPEVVSLDESADASDDSDETDEDELFVENLKAVLQKYPELIDLMEDPRVSRDYENLVQLQNDLDQEGVIKAEIADSQQTPYAGNSLQGQDAYDSAEYPAVNERYAHPEVAQQYPGDAVARVVSKKRGYETPPEYLGMLGLEPSQQQSLAIDARSAEHGDLEQEQMKSYMKMGM